MRAKLAWALLPAALLAAGIGAPTSAQDRGPAAISEIRVSTCGSWRRGMVPSMQ